MGKLKNLDSLIDRMVPSVRKAFRESIKRVTSTIRIADLEKAIGSGDVSRVLSILDLGPEFFGPLDKALADAFRQAGEAAVAAMVQDASRSGVKVRAFFDATNPRAVEWLRNRSSELIVEIAEEQRQVVRQVLARGVEAAKGPRSTALDIVGRVNRATGARQGGVIGLHSQMEGWSNAAYQELIQGDPAYFRRKRRPKQFDAFIAKQMREKGSVNVSDAQRVITGYRSKLLDLRGTTVARTELLGSVHEATNEGLRQMVAKGNIRDEDIKRTWDASNDSDTRESHAAMDGNSTQGSEGVFTTGDGYLMRYPGDRSLGAPGKEIINCRCVIRTEVDWIAQLAREEGVLG